MKHYLILTFLLLSFLKGFGQIDRDKLIGTWKYINHDDSSFFVMPSFSVKFDDYKKFELTLYETKVNGNWRIKDSTLTIIGKKGKKTKKERISVKIVRIENKLLEIDLASSDEEKQKSGSSSILILIKE